MPFLRGSTSPPRSSARASEDRCLLPTTRVRHRRHCARVGQDGVRDRTLDGLDPMLPSQLYRILTDDRVKTTTEDVPEGGG
jgi:hypothetical protein